MEHIEMELDSPSMNSDKEPQDGHVHVGVPKLVAIISNILGDEYSGTTVFTQLRYYIVFRKF